MVSSKLKASVEILIFRGIREKKYADRISYKFCFLVLAENHFWVWKDIFFQVEFIDHL